MFMRLVTPSTRRLLDGVGRDGRANVKVFARCKRAINDVRPQSFEGRAPRDRLLETKGRPAVGACDHEHIVPGVSRLVSRSQRRSYASDGRVTVYYPDASAGRERAPLREGLILDTDGSCTSLSEAADRPAEVRGAAEARVAVDDERHAAGRPDALTCSFFHLDPRDDAGIRLASARTYSKSRQEKHLRGCSAGAVGGLRTASIGHCAGLGRQPRRRRASTARRVRRGTRRRPALAGRRGAWPLR